MTLLRATTPLAVLCLGATLAQADPRGTPVPDAAAQIVNTAIQHSQSAPEVAALTGPSRGHVVVWQSVRYLNSGTTSRSLGVFAQRFGADDAKVGPEIRVSPETLLNSMAPVVKGLADGRFVVAWSAADGSQSGIFARVYEADGSPRGNPALVNTLTVRQQIAPRLARLDDGRFVVVWQSNHYPLLDSRELEVRAQIFTEDGDKSGGEIAVNTKPRLRCCADVASLADGGFVAVWPGFDTLAASPGLFGQRLDAGGNPVGGEFRVADGYDISRPGVAGLANGGFMVVWAHAFTDPYRTLVLSRRYAAVGGAFDTREIATVPGFRTVAPAIDRLENGEVVVALTGEDSATYLQRLTDRGVKIGGLLKLTGPARYRASVAGLAEEAAPFVAAWVAPDGDDTGIEARRMRVQGAPRAEPDLATTATAEPVIIDVLANDTDPNPGVGDLRLITSALALDGTATIVANGKRIRYVPGRTCAATDTITYTMQGSNGESATAVVAVTIVPAPVMVVTPATAIAFTGPVGGPFAPATTTLTIRNRGCSALTWARSLRFDGLIRNWFSAVVSGADTLAPDAVATIEVKPTAKAALLAGGSYTGAVRLANTSNGRGDALRGVTLDVTPATATGAW